MELANILIMPNKEFSHRKESLTPFNFFFITISNKLKHNYFVVTTQTFILVDLEKAYDKYVFKRVYKNI